MAHIQNSFALAQHLNISKIKSKIDDTHSGSIPLELCGAVHMTKWKSSTRRDTWRCRKRRKKIGSLSSWLTFAFWIVWFWSISMLNAVQWIRCDAIRYDEYFSIVVSLQQPTSDRHAQTLLLSFPFSFSVSRLWFMFQCSFLPFVFLIEFACNIFQGDRLDLCIFIDATGCASHSLCTVHSERVRRKQWKKLDCSFWYDVA